VWGQVVRIPGIGCWEHIAEARARRMLEAVGRWVEGNWPTVDNLTNCSWITVGGRRDNRDGDFGDVFFMTGCFGRTWLH